MAGGKSRRKQHQSTSEDQGLFSKQDLLDCFASKEFAMHVVAAVDPHLKTLTNQLNRNSSRITKQEYEIEDLNKKLDEQATKLANLETKVTTKERSEKQCILRFTGLPENESEAVKKLVNLCNEKLETPLNEGEFLLQKPRPSSTNTNTNTNGKKKPTTHIVNFFNIWKRRSIYKNRTKLKGTNVYISEPLSKQQQALFYRCRSLCKSRELKATWTYESVIYVRSWDDTQRVISEEGDLRGMMRPRKDTPFSTPKSSLSDVSEGSFHGFPVMDPVPTDKQENNNTCAREDDPPEQHQQQHQPPEEVNYHQEEDQMSESWVGKIKARNVMYASNVCTDTLIKCSAVCVNVWFIWNVYHK